MQPLTSFCINIAVGPAFVVEESRRGGLLMLARTILIAHTGLFQQTDQAGLAFTGSLILR